MMTFFLGSRPASVRLLGLSRSARGVVRGKAPPKPLKGIGGGGAQFRPDLRGKCLQACLRCLSGSSGGCSLSGAVRRDCRLSLISRGSAVLAARVRYRALVVSRRQVGLGLPLVFILQPGLFRCGVAGVAVCGGLLC